MTREGERVYRERPVPGPIETALSRLGARERGVARALHCRNAAETIWKGEKGFEHEGIRIVFTAQPVLSGNRVAFWVQAFAGRQALPVDNPYVFVNPPTLVPDGTWRKAGDRDVPNFRESPEEALKEALVDAVRDKARRMGWRG